MKHLAICCLIAWGMSAGAQPTTKPNETELARLRREVAELRQEVMRLLKENRDLLARVAPATQPDQSPYRSGLTIGMTLAQADAAIGRKGRLMNETVNERVYEWDKGIQMESRVISQKFYARFRDGKLVEHWRGLSTEQPRSAPTRDSRGLSR